MAAITTSTQSVINSKKFIDEYVSEESYLYLAIAKTDPWNNDLASSVDSSPFVPNESKVHLNEFRSNVIAMKRILPTQLINTVPRYDWQSGITYTQWDDSDVDIETSRFYVMTQTFDVYKCLKSGSGASTVQPSHITTEPKIYADGYVWHYLYRIPTSDALQFLNSEFIPVKNGSSAEHIAHEVECKTELDGGIFSIVVTNGGSGYVTAPTVTIQGNGTGATATATISGGVVTGINIDTVNTDELAHGNGYFNAKVLISAPPSGTTATARAIISPKNGHGTNVEEELYAYYVQIATALSETEEGKFIVGNDFRQIGLIKNPVEFGEEWSNYSTSITLNALSSIELTGVSGGNFSPDDVIKQTTGTNLLARAFVDQVNTDSPYTLFVHQNDKTGWVPFETSQTVRNGNGSGTVSGTISQINNPDVDIYSGDVIYLENRTKIARTETSREEIRIILQF
jgi:hypothetical protein